MPAKRIKNPSSEGEGPTSQEISLVQHNCEITATQNTQLRILHREWMAKNGKTVSYAKWFRTVALPRGLDSLLAEYPTPY